MNIFTETLGKMKKSNIHLTDVYPVLIGKDGNIARLIVERWHQRVDHVEK